MQTTIENYDQGQQTTIKNDDQAQKTTIKNDDQGQQTMIENDDQGQQTTVDTMNETSDAANLLLLLANGTPRREPDYVENIQSEDLIREPSIVPDNLREEVDISDIILPPKIQKCGRPKGSELTVIGLPKKRLKLQKSKCVAFERMNDSQKQSLVLSWVVEKSVVEKCMSGNYKIQEDEVEVNPENIPLAFKDAELDIIKMYFTDDAWKSLQQTVNIRNSKNVHVMCVQKSWKRVL